MHICSRIPSAEFHSEAQRRHTNREVGALLQSPQFAAYLRHKEHQATLHYFSIIAPVVLFVAFYADFVFMVMSDQTSFVGSTVSMLLPSHAHVAVGLLLIMRCFVLPVCQLAPFCGMFRDVVAEEGNTLVSVMILLTVVIRDTYLRASTVEASVDTSVPVLLLRLCAELGGIGTAYVVCQLRSLPWKRNKALPYGALWLPFAVGAIDVSCRFVFVALSDSWKLCATDEQRLTVGACAVVCVKELLTRLTRGAEQFITAGVVTSVLHYASFGFGVDVVSGDEGHQHMTAVAKGVVGEWNAAFWLSTVAMVVALFSPTLHSIAEAVHATFQPKHPTTIMLSGVAAVVTVAFLGALGYLSLPLFTLGSLVAVWIWSSDWASEGSDDQEAQ